VGASCSTSLLKIGFHCLFLGNFFIKVDIACDNALISSRLFDIIYLSLIVEAKYYECDILFDCPGLLVLVSEVFWRYLFNY